MYTLFCRCYPDYTIYLKTNHYIMHFVEGLSKNTLYFIVFITSMGRGFLALNTKTKHIHETIQQYPIIQSYDREFHIHLLNNILCSLFKSCQIKTLFFFSIVTRKRHRASQESRFLGPALPLTTLRHGECSLNSHQGLRFLNYTTKGLNKINSKEHSHQTGFC